MAGLLEASSSRGSEVQLDLVEAAQRGDIAAVARALKKKADPNADVPIGYSRSHRPLSAAIGADAPECCALIIEAGAIVTQLDLDRAADLASSRTLDLLLRKKNERTDDDEETPATKKRQPVKKVREKQGFPSLARGRLLGRELHGALNRGDDSRAEDLCGEIEASASRTAALTWKDGNHWTVLHSAAAAGNLSVCERLVDLGISTASRTAQGLDVLDIACQAGQAKVLAMLLNRKTTPQKIKHEHNETDIQNAPPSPPPPSSPAPLFTHPVPIEVASDLAQDQASDAIPSDVPTLDYACNTEEDYAAVPTFESGGGAQQTFESGAPQTFESAGAPQTFESGIAQTFETGAPQTFETGAPQTFESGVLSPQTFESGVLSPQTFESGAPQTFESGAPQTFESGAPRTFESGAPQTFKSGVLSPQTFESGAWSPATPATLESRNLGVPATPQSLALSQDDVSAAGGSMMMMMCDDTKSVIAEERAPKSLEASSLLSRVSEPPRQLRVSQKNLDVRLLRASEKGDPKAISSLLSRGARAATVRPTDGFNSLHALLAAKENDDEDRILRCATMLLQGDKGGAVVATADRQGYLPLFYACRQQGLAVTKLLLLRAPESATHRSPAGATALCVAAAAGRADLFRPLVDAGADPNARTSAGQSVLGFSAGRGDDSAIRLLLDLGATTRKERGPKSALRLSLERRHYAAAETLLRSGGHPLDFRAIDLIKRSSCAPLLAAMDRIQTARREARLQSEHAKLEQAETDRWSLLQRRGPHSRTHDKKNGLITSSEKQAAATLLLRGA